MADDFQDYPAQGDFQPTPYANDPEIPVSSDFPAQGDFAPTPYSSAIDAGFDALFTPQNAGGYSDAAQASGAYDALRAEKSGMGFMSSILRNFTDPKSGDLNKMGTLAFASGSAVLGELFSGAKKSAAANAKQMADAAKLNSESSAKRVANMEAERQNALTSTSTAFGPTSGLIGRAKFTPINKPNWKV